jgi:hypothetical protein
VVKSGGVLRVAQVRSVFGETVADICGSNTGLGTADGAGYIGDDSFKVDCIRDDS